MLIYNLLSQLLELAVSKAPFSAFFKQVLLKGLELAITPEGLLDLESKGKDLVIGLIDRVEAANPDLKGTLDTLKAAIQSATL
jgi:hypothetical protein